MLSRTLLAGLFALLLAWAQWEELGPPKDAAILEVATEPRLPARVYLFKGESELRLTPVDAVLPLRSDLFYRDTFYSKTPDPATMEVVAADQYHCLLLKGAARFVLPPGKYRMEAYRGLFYKPASIEFELKRGETTRATLPLTAWTDPSAWISADDHIHLTRARKHDAVYLAWLAAEDLTVGNFLELQRQMHAAVQYGFGRSAEARRAPGYVIRSGHESRNEFWGHINILGPDRMIEPLSTGTMYAHTAESYPFPSLLFAQGRKAGGVVGYAHFFERPQHSTIYMDAALGNIDFVEVFQFGVLKSKAWYELLNAGLRVTGIAGSDFPVPMASRKPWPRWLPLLGPERALVKARPGENSYDAWARGVREGRVIVSNGPLVELEMSSRNRATARAAFHRPLETVEIVRNGVVVASGPGPVVTAVIEDSESCWVAARVRAARGSDKAEPELWGHTNPVYLERGGRPVRVEADRRAVAAKWEEQLAAFRAAGIQFPDEGRRREFFDLAEKALAELRR